MTLTFHFSFLSQAIVPGLPSVFLWYSAPPSLSSPASSSSSHHSTGGPTNKVSPKITQTNKVPPKSLQPIKFDLKSLKPGRSRTMCGLPHISRLCLASYSSTAATMSAEYLPGGSGGLARWDAGTRFSRATKKIVFNCRVRVGKA